MADYDDLNTKRIFMVGILSIVVTAVTALAVQVVYYALVSWHDAELSEKSSYRRQNAVLAEQTAEITNYGVNPDTGAVTIPVSKAMELIAADNKGGEDAESHDHAAEPKADAKQEHGEKKHDEKEHNEEKHAE